MAELHQLADYSESETRRQEARDHSMGALVKELSEETSLLVRQEVALAKLELSEKARVAAVGGGLLGSGGMLGYLGLGALTAAAILGLSEVFVPWLAALIVGGVYLLIALGLFLAGRLSLRRAGSPVPEETVQSIREDAEWIRQRSRSSTK